MKQQNEDDVVVIRRYGNRRLYDTRSSAYVNLADVRALVREGQRIRVVDSATEEDVTRRVLTQIVLESADEKGLPLDLLYELARASDRAFRDFLDWYLKSSMEVYRRLQESWQVDASRRWGETRPALEAWAQLWDPRQVAASLAQLISPFDRRTPGSGGAGSAASDQATSAQATSAEAAGGQATGSQAPSGASKRRTAARDVAAPSTAASAAPSSEIDELRRRLDELERRLAGRTEGAAQDPPRS